MGAIKKRKVNRHSVKNEFADIDELYRQLENDKNLPTFGKFFMHCVIFNIAECANLKKMYPRTHAKLSKWLERNKKMTLRSRKENV